jgi:hypothetical protein
VFSDGERKTTEIIRRQTHSSGWGHHQLGRSTGSRQS